MFWLPGTQTVDYDDPAFRAGETWSRRALASIDPNLVLYSVDPYSKVLSADFQQEDMIATLTALFGAIGLVLAAVGLYGVLAYTVERRTGESVSGWPWARTAGASSGWSSPARCSRSQSD
jgi:hypothetical protein